VLNITLADYSTHNWVTAFNDEGAIILGKTAQELNGLKEMGNDAAYEQVFGEACFTTWVFKIRAKMEHYQVCRLTARRISH